MTQLRMHNPVEPKRNVTVRLDESLIETLDLICEELYTEKLDRSSVIRTALLRWIDEIHGCLLRDGVLTQADIDETKRRVAAKFLGGDTPLDVAMSMTGVPAAAMFHEFTKTSIDALNRLGLKHAVDKPESGERYVHVGSGEPTHGPGAVAAPKRTRAVTTSRRKTTTEKSREAQNADCN